jgi:hypothetical protein
VPPFWTWAAAPGRAGRTVQIWSFRYQGSARQRITSPFMSRWPVGTNPSRA